MSPNPALDLDGRASEELGRAGFRVMAAGQVLADDGSVSIAAALFAGFQSKGNRLPSSSGRGP